MIMKEIADRVRQARIDREKTLRLKKAGILALGLTIGSTVGALAGVLFAPRAGEETREDLIRRGCNAWGKIQENASHTGHRLASAVEEKSSRVRKVAEQYVDVAKGALKEPPKEDEGTDNKN
ncbi:MAG: YtxH domain-containing protein [Syntrophobacteraceae bacterium]